MNKNRKNKVNLLMIPDNCVLQCKNLFGKTTTISPGRKLVFGSYKKVNMDQRVIGYEDVSFINQFGYAVKFDIDVSYKVAGGLEFDDNDSQIYINNVEKYAALEREVNSNDWFSTKGEVEDTYFSDILDKIDLKGEKRWWLYNHPVKEYLKNARKIAEEELANENGNSIEDGIIKNSIKDALSEVFNNYDNNQMEKLSDNSLEIKKLFLAMNRNFLKNGLQLTNINIKSIRYNDNIVNYSQDDCIFISEDDFKDVGYIKAETLEESLDNENKDTKNDIDYSLVKKKKFVLAHKKGKDVMYLEKKKKTRYGAELAPDPYESLFEIDDSEDIKEEDTTVEQLEFEDLGHEEIEKTEEISKEIIMQNYRALNESIKTISEQAEEEEQLEEVEPIIPEEVSEEEEVEAIIPEATVDEEIEEFEDDYISYQEDNSNKKENIKLSRKIKSLENENKKLLDENNSLVQENDDLRTDNKELISLSEELLEENEELQNTNSTLLSSKAGLLVAFEGLEDEISRLEKDNVDLDKESLDQFNELDDLRSSNKKLRNSNILLEEDNKDLVRENYELNEEKEFSISSKDAEIEELNNKIKLLEATNNELVEELTNADNQNSDLKASNEDYLKKIKELEEENKQLKDDNKSLDKKEEYEKRINNLKNDISNMTKENAKLTEELKEKDNNIKELNKELSDKDKVITDLNEKIAALDEKVNELSSVVDQIKEKPKANSLVTNLKIYKVNIKRCVLVNDNKVNKMFNVAINGELMCKDDSDLNLLVNKMVALIIKEKTGNEDVLIRNIKFEDEIVCLDDEKFINQDKVKVMKKESNN